MGRVTSRARAVRVEVETDGTSRRRDRVETLAVEAPMQVRVDGEPLSVTMRTPGDDFALASGFLVSEGVLADPAELARIAYCAGAEGPDGANTYNVVDVRLADGVPGPDVSLDRRVFTNSSCGLCGRVSLDTVRTTARWPLPLPRGPRLDPAVLAELPDRLRAAQRVFARTGGLHAAALCTADGSLLDVREDVGRHNAVDKIVGHALTSGALPLSGTVLLVSGRASFELVQKAVLAGIPTLAAVSAPSALAVDLAAETGMTLVGFLRGASMNVYSGAERLGLADEAGLPPEGETRGEVVEGTR